MFEDGFTAFIYDNRKFAQRAFYYLSPARFRFCETVAGMRKIVIMKGRKGK